MSTEHTPTAAELRASKTCVGCDDVPCVSGEDTPATRKLWGFPVCDRCYAIGAADCEREFQEETRELEREGVVP